MARTEQSVIAIYRQHNDWMVAGDVQQLGQLLDPNFQLVHMTGMVQTKAEWLHAIQTGQMHYFSSTEEHVTVTELTDDTATLVGQSQVDASIYGSRNTWPLQLTLHLAWQADGWKIMHIDAAMY